MFELHNFMTEPIANIQNQFMQKLKDEYRSHVHEIFGVTFEEFVSAVPGGEKKFNEDCKEAYEQRGMAGVRYMIKSHIAVLDFLYFMKSKDKQWFFEEFVERAMSLGIGIRRSELVPWNWSSISAKGEIVQEAANDTDQRINA